MSLWLSRARQIQNQSGNKTVIAGLLIAWVRCIIWSIFPIIFNIYHKLTQEYGEEQVSFFFPPFPFRSNVHLSHKMRMLIKIIIVVCLHILQYTRLVHVCLDDVFIIDYYACLTQTLCTKLFLCKNARNLLPVLVRQPKRMYWRFTRFWNYVFPFL